MRAYTGVRILQQGASSFHSLERAMALHRSGKVAEAFVAYEKAMAERPGDAQAPAMAAMLAHQTGDASRAIALLGKSLAIAPGNTMLQFNLAALLQSVNRNEEAVARYDEVVRVNTGNESAWNNRGNALLSLGRCEDAVESFRRAIAVKPAYLEAHYNLGNALLVASRGDEALASFDRVLTLDPRFPEGHLGRGEALLKLAQFSAAESSFRAAVSHRPDLAQAHNSLGVSLRGLGRLNEALRAHERAIELAPDFSEAHYNIGTIRAELLRLDEAIESLNRALAIRPSYGDARWNRGLCHLLKGNFAQGWPDYEGRIDSPEFYERSADEIWQHLDLKTSPSRQDFVDRSVIVFEEQGVGDVIMFASMVPDLSEIARQVFLIVDERLTTLLQRSFPDVHVISKKAFAEAGAHDAEVKILLGSMAHAFRRSNESFPRRPYLIAGKEKISDWKRRLGKSHAKTIGISWKGGTQRNNRQARSMDLSEFEPLLSRDDCLFVSLQHGDSEEEILNFERTTGRALLRFRQEVLHDLDDLAALIGALDAVVSVQNTNVHISGALGVPCYAILPEHPEWRYGLKGNQIAWYDSVHLFRRSKARPTQGVLEEIGEALTQLVSR